MLNLLLKDYKFTKKYGLLMLLYCVAVPILLVVDGGEKLYYASFFIPFVSCTLLIGRICNMEDSNDVRAMQKLLPYSNGKRIAARFLFMISLLMISQTYLSFVQSCIFRQGQFIALYKDNILLGIVYGIYFSIYLVLFYLLNNFWAQNSVYVCMVVIGILAVGYEKLGLDIDFYGWVMQTNKTLWMIVGTGIIFLLYLLACIGDRKRKLI